MIKKIVELAYSRFIKLYKKLFKKAILLSGTKREIEEKSCEEKKQGKAPPLSICEQISPDNLHSTTTWPLAQRSRWQNHQERRNGFATLFYSLDFNLKQSMQLSTETVQQCYTSLETSVKVKSCSYSKLSKKERSCLCLQLHHLLPKHDGGGNQKENLVFVSVEDHALLHFWRYQLYNQRYDKQAVLLILSNPVTRKKLGRERAHPDLLAARLPAVRPCPCSKGMGMGTGKAKPFAKKIRKGCSKPSPEVTPNKSLICKPVPVPKGHGLTNRRFASHGHARTSGGLTNKKRSRVGTAVPTACANPFSRKLEILLTRHIKWYSKKNDGFFVTAPSRSLEGLCKQVQLFEPGVDTPGKLLHCLKRTPGHTLGCVLIAVL